ncbi:MAG: hypothetical protein VX638_13455 [Chloroflexota bacterium]|nr:hypothetical protein [Chloroflexota bacterium]
MAKIAISPPEKTLQAVEQQRQANGLSRSEFYAARWRNTNAGLES